MILEILEVIPYTVHTQAVLPIAALVAGQAVVGIMGLYNANKAKNNAATLANQLENLENSRQEIYDAADDIRAMKGQISNPYANLPVAVKASQIQAEQTDQALANTLDTLAAGGFGAGGATALARAAERSKRDIAANIEQQEVNNAKLRAEGEAQVQNQKMQLDQAAIRAEQNQWQQQEERELMALDRAQSQLDQAQAQEMQYRQDALSAFTGAMNLGAGNLGGTFGTSGGSVIDTAAGSTSSGYNYNDFMKNVNQPINLGSGSKLLQ